MIILPDFRIHQRDYILKISRAITAQLDLQVVLRMVLEASVSMLGGEVGLIALRGPRKRLVVKAVLGVDEDEAALFDNLLELTKLDAAEMLDSDEARLHLRLIARKLDRTLRQVVPLPLRISGEALGVIYVFRAYPGTPTPDDLRILQSFADQAAIAVHNAGLYQATMAEKRRLDTILDASADGIMILDGATRVMRMNPMLAQMTGWPLEYVINRYHDDIIRWTDPAPGLRLEDMMDEGWPFAVEQNEEGEWESASGVVHVEGDLERLDGMRLSVEIKYAPVFAEDGTLRNIIANVRDITRFREAEEMKSTFISVMSHELKTPVALIKGYAQTLSRDDATWDTDTIRRGLLIIEDEADRLTQLIENILMASRVQVEGMIKLNPTAIRLADIAQSVLERFATQTNKHDLQLRFDDDLPVVYGDATKLRQVFDNLVSNAIKYSPQGGTVRVGGTYSDDEVQVYVRDEGAGISDEDAQRIFDRFYRTQSAIKGSAPGTGLGLYLVRVIIEAHGGRIWARPNADGLGTTFVFTLPIDSVIYHDDQT
jgi:PAS domain S-box-containing protein